MNKNLCVIDTNVALAANSQADVSKECVLACIKQLEKIMQQGGLALDDKWLILREYMHKLSSSGQPGMGDKFLKWVLTNQRNPSRCTQVSITPKPEDPLDFLEFPAHPQLQQFDRADRKFVAVSIKHPGHPPILQAADSKWWGWQQALAECGIRVIFVCPEELAEKYQKKMGQP
jgi:hypothetical protein